MLLIANRGNLFGSQPDRENTIDYLNEAMSLGYHVMADLWWHEGSFWFGNSRPTQKIQGDGRDWLRHASNSLWLHARNPGALLEATDLDLNVFWRQTDQYVLTSWAYLLGFNGVPSYGNAFVHVFPQEEFLVDNQQIEKILDWAQHDHAFCADYVGSISDYLTAQSTPSNDPRTVSISSVA